MALLELLRGGAFHSGEELGLALGISRAAVWKQVALLKKRGVSIEAARGKGYRLLGMVEQWDRDLLLAQIGPGLRDKVTAFSLERRVTSTNDVVASLLRECPGGVAISLAEEQTRGRGRRGRDWYSPLSYNFYGSLGCSFEGGIAQVAGLSLAVGVVIARVLNAEGAEQVKIKWPNDLVVNGAKLGGILIELHAEAAGPCQVILGVGINFQLPEDASQRLGRPVVDLASVLPQALERNYLGGLLLREMVRLLLEFPEKGLSAYLADWDAFDALRGLEVDVSGLSTDLTGVACGVDANGALLLLSGGRTISINAGELSVRSVCR